MFCVFSAESSPDSRGVGLVGQYHAFSMLATSLLCSLSICVQEFVRLFVASYRLQDAADGLSRSPLIGE